MRKFPAGRILVRLMSDAQRKSSAVALGYGAIGSLSLVMRVALTSIKVATDLLLALNGARKQGNIGQSVTERPKPGDSPGPPVKLALKRPWRTDMLPVPLRKAFHNYRQAESKLGEALVRGSLGKKEVENLKVAVGENLEQLLRVIEHFLLKPEAEEEQRAKRAIASMKKNAADANED